VARYKSISIGSSTINASDLKGLRYAWRHRQLVLFLGAGVSMSYGIPTWKDLVLEMLFDQTQHARRMKNLWPHYRRAVTSWLADYFEYNPVILARIIEDDIRERAKKSRSSGDAFLRKLRQHLYAAYRTNNHQTTLTAVADLIKQSDGNIQAVVTFNFDDLLEAELKTRGVDFVSVFTDARQPQGRLPIIHPHGYIPRRGPLKEGVIFTERHYHELMESVFHWSLTEIVNHLRHHTVLFLGLSMSDPNIRRLLDACRNSDIPSHWQVQKRHEIRDQERWDVAREIEARARRWAEVLKTEEQKKGEELLDVIDDSLKQADTYDRTLFEKMGVKTVWLKDLADIPALLQAISRTHRSV